MSELTETLCSGSDNGRGREARQGLQPGDVRCSLRRAAVGEGAKRDEVCSPATCGVLFGARRWARARRRTIFSPARCSARVGVSGRRRWGARSAVRCRGDLFLGACRRRQRRGGLQLYQLRAAWGATEQLSGIWLGLWVRASGGAAQSASMFISLSSGLRRALTKNAG